MPLVPLSATEFLDRNFLGHITISHSTEGTLDGLTYRYAGKQFAAHRVAGK